MIGVVVEFGRNSCWARITVPTLGYSDRCRDILTCAGQRITGSAKKTLRDQERGQC